MDDVNKEGGSDNEWRKFIIPRALTADPKFNGRTVGGDGGP